MSKKTILVDMDEVIVGLLDSWLCEYHALGGERAYKSGVTSYSMAGQFLNMPLFWKAIDDEYAIADAKVLPGALDALQALYEAHDVYVLTYARVESFGRAHAQKLEWLECNAPWFNRDKVIFARYKHLVRGDFLIEDSADNVRAWLAADCMGQAILIDQPWNRNATDLNHRREASLATAAAKILSGELL